MNRLIKLMRASAAMVASAVVCAVMQRRGSLRYMTTKRTIGVAAIVAILLGATVMDVLAADSAAWLDAMSGSRPLLLRKEKPSRGLDSNAVHGDWPSQDADKIVAKYTGMALSSPITWENAYSAADGERVDTCSFTADDGSVNRFSVLSYRSALSPYAWTSKSGKAGRNFDPVEFARLRFNAEGTSSISWIGRLVSATDVEVRELGEVIAAPWDKYYFFLVDDLPGANWSHPCRYVFLSEDGSSFAVLYKQHPPRLFSTSDGAKIYLQVAATEDESMETDAAKQLNAVTSKVYSYANSLREENSLSYSTGNKSRSHFVLICGGADPQGNGIRFWCDTAMLYSTLTLKYGVSKDHIHVYMSDGTSSDADANLASTSSGVTPVLVSSPLDLDGDGYSDIDGAATKSGVRSCFNSLASSLSSSDQLFVFITSHGSPEGTAGPNNYGCLAWLYAADGGSYGSDGESAYFWDEDLAEWTSGMACPVAFAIETCYSGGFIDDITQMHNRVIATACNHCESSWGLSGGGNWRNSLMGSTGAYNRWAAPFSSALRGCKPAPYASYGYPWADGTVVDADSNGDGLVSFNEARLYAYSNDAKRCTLSTHTSTCGKDNSVEHPQYAESTSGLGDNFFMLKQAASVDPRWSFSLTDSTVGADGGCILKKTFGADGGTYDVSITCDSSYMGSDVIFLPNRSINNSWPDWFSDEVLLTSSSTVTKWRLKVLPNNSSSDRYVYVTVSYKELSQRVLIYQEGQSQSVTTYTVTYKPGTNGAGSQQTATKTQNVALTLKDATFTRTGYTQTGWSIIDGGSKMYNLGALYTDNASLTLYPYWTANTYMITFDHQGGSGGETTKWGWDYNGLYVGTFSVPTKNGYDFGGYYSEKNGGGNQYISSEGKMVRRWDIASDWTLYAYWIPHTTTTYSITYVLGGGTAGTSTPTSATYDTAFKVSAPSRSGYVFIGWTVTSGLNTSTAKYGTTSSSQTTSITSSSQKCLNGATGDVWFKNLCSTSGSVTLTANWNPTVSIEMALDNTSISFSTGGSSSWIGQTMITHDGIDAARSGVLGNSQTNWLQTTVSGPGTISFWWYASSEQGYDFLEFLIDGNIMASMSGTNNVWTSKSFTISTSGGHALQWRYRKDGSVDKGDDAGFVDQVTWTPLQTYTVTYKSGSHISGSTYTATKTNNVALALRNATYSRTGYTQTAWSTSSDGTSRNYELGANYTANVALTLYPYWTTNAYTISYSLNGGTHGATHPSSATYDTAFKVSAPTKSGYTFTGWTVTSGLNTVTAKWGTTSTPATSLTSSSTKCVNGATGNVYFKNLRSTTGSVTLTANWTCDHSSTFVQNARAATCTEAGYTGDTVCCACGATIATGSTIPALGHQEGEGVVTKEPTTTEEGVMTYSCTRCGITMRTEAIPKIVTALPDLGFTAFTDWDFGYYMFTTTNSEGGGVFSSAPVRLFDCHELFSVVYGYANFGEAAILNATVRTMYEMVSESGAKVVETSQGNLSLESYWGSQSAMSAMSWTNLAAGVYTARVTLDAENAIGDTNRANNVREFVYAIRDSLPLGDALGAVAPVFETNGDDWYGTRDGVDQTVAYARTKHLGNYGTNVLSTTVSGAGALSFDWKVSSEQNYDWLEFLIDGVVTNRISGTNCVWQSCSYELSDGNHAVEWRYRKDESYYAGLDCAWLANIEWNPTTVYTITFNSNGGTGTMAAQTFTNGVAQALRANAFTRTGYAFAGWATNTTGAVVYPNGASVSPAADMTLYAKWNANTYSVTLNRQGGSDGTASVTATYGSSMPSISKPTRSGYMFGGYYTSPNGSGTQYYTAAGVSARTWNIANATTLYANWIPTVPLNTALDNTALTFTTGGSANWVGVPDESYYGGSSAKSGAITHGQSTWMQTEVTGEGALSFWYKVSSETNWDKLMFYVDGVQKTAASGTVGWSRFECVISNSTQHVIKWTYSKDVSVSSGSDCCWIDKVEWTPKAVIPTIAVDASAETVNAAVDSVGFADAGVKAAIGGNASEYKAFKTWASGVAGGEAAVVASTHAAAAYLLGAERLFENEPTVEIGELAIADGESAGTTAMTVAVTVKDGENAVKCAAEKVKEMFEATSDLGDWTGSAKLTPKVTTADTDASGKMTFVVTPGDGTAKSAFLRIRQ